LPCGALPADLFVPRADLGRLEPLATGGTARLYRVPDYRCDGEVVFKEYLPKIRESAGPGLRSGLHAIAKVRDGLADRQRSLFDTRMVWPLRVVENEQREAVGILMRLLADRFFFDLHAKGRTERTTRELLHILYEDDLARRKNAPLLTAPQRVALCGQIARCFALLHGADVVFGDVSFRNVIFDAGSGPAPDVMLVDCDSVRVRGTRSPFGAQPHTPTWEPPEALKARRQLQQLSRGQAVSSASSSDLRRASMIQSKATDVYKFALLVIRALDYGRNRAPNKNPAVALSVLRRHGHKRLQETLSSSLAPEPDDRPTMRDWFEAFTGQRHQPVAPAPAAVPVAAQVAAPLTANTPAVEPTYAGWERTANGVWQRRRP